MDRIGSASARPSRILFFGGAGHVIRIFHMNVTSSEWQFMAKKVRNTDKQILHTDCSIAASTLASARRGAGGSPEPEGEA